MATSDDNHTYGLASAPPPVPEPPSSPPSPPRPAPPACPPPPTGRARGRDRGESSTRRHAGRACWAYPRLDPDPDPDMGEPHKPGPGGEGGGRGRSGLLGHHPIPSHPSHPIPSHPTCTCLPACLPIPRGVQRYTRWRAGGSTGTQARPWPLVPACLPAYMEACLPACPSRYVKCVERRRGSLSSRLPVGRGKGRGRYREREGDGGRGGGGGRCSERGSPPPGHWARCCRARRLAGGLEAGAHEGQAAVARGQRQARRPLPARPPAIEAPSAADSRQPPSAGRGRGKGEGVGGARLLACLAAT